MDPELTHAQERSPRDGVEAELLLRFRGGDASAYESLVRPHLAALLGLARRLVTDQQWAEDLTQETLVRAFRGLAAFRADCSVRTWLFRIQTRLASEPTRWRGRDCTDRVPALEIPDRVGPAPDDVALHRELRDRLDEAMERLPMRQRTALHLRAAEGLDYEAIAEVLVCSRGAARMLVLAARRQVLARMGRFLAP